MSGCGENSGPKEGIWLRNGFMPPLPEVLTESLQSCVGRRPHELDKTRQIEKRESSEFETPRGERGGNMDATGLGVNGVKDCYRPDRQAEDP